MKADQINKARNPLLPAAAIALQRAAQRARREALLTHTGIVVERAGRIERIEWNRVQEPEAQYDAPAQSSRREGDS